MKITEAVAMTEIVTATVTVNVIVAIAIAIAATELVPATAQY
ncbi:hypothetical protein [Paenibacillus sp. 481]|nr:hypothetical protein [Paenibacillus sp. 481]